MRAIFDAQEIGLILIGMPGLEKRLARYPQFYSRIGFVHEFRPLSPDEVRQLLQRRWTPPGVKLPSDSIDATTAASIILITGGNFRLLNRLLTQMERILEVNSLEEVTKAVVEAARVRLRPIVMTTMCFIHMAPPYFATGAGAEMRRSVGTAMLWGAFGVTLFGLFLTPVFYSVVRRLTGRKSVKPARPHGLAAVPARAVPGDLHARNGKADHAILDLTSGRQR